MGKEYEANVLIFIKLFHLLFGKNITHCNLVSKVLLWLKLDSDEMLALQFDLTEKHLLAHKSAYIYILMRIKMILITFFGAYKTCGGSVDEK